MHELRPFVLDHRAHLVEGNFDALERDDVSRKTPLEAGFRSIRAWETGTYAACIARSSNPRLLRELEHPLLTAGYGAKEARN
jgi:hypothetical protein